MNRPTAYDAERLLRRNAYGAGAFLVVVAMLGTLLFLMRADFSWSMFVMMGVIAVIFLGIAMSYAPQATLLGLIFTKPLIDQLWWFRAFGGLNFQAVIGAVVPIIAFIFLFLTRNEFFLKAPMCIWIRRLCYLTVLMLGVQHFLGNKIRIASVAEEFRIISGPALFFLTGWLFTKGEDVKRLSKAVIWSSIWIFTGIAVAYAIGKEHFGIGAFGDNPLEGMYYHKHDLARVSTMVCIFSLCLIKMTNSTAVKILNYLITAAMMVIIFSSYTRMSWIALFACVCFWYVWMGRWKQVLVIAPFVLVLSWSTLDRAFEKAHVTSANPNLADPKFASGRGAIWKAQIEGFQDMNIVEQMLGGGYNRSVGLSAEYEGVARNAHSCIPLMLVENGILFTLLYNILLFKLCRDAWALRKTGDSKLQILGALFLVGVAYFHLSGITTNSHTYPSLTWYVWGLGGIVYRIRHFAEADKKEEAPANHRFFSRELRPRTPGPTSLLSSQPATSTETLVGTMGHSTRTRVAIIQSRLAPFRIALFERLGRCADLDVTVFCSAEDAAGKNARSEAAASFRLRPLRTFTFGRLTLQPSLPGLILAGGFDAVIAEARLGLVLNPLVMALCRITGRRFLWWTCGWEPGEAQAVSKLKRFGRRVLFACAHGGIAYSKVAQRYLTRLGMSPQRTWVAQNSLDTDSLLALECELRKDEGLASRLRKQYNAVDKLIVLFVGKLVETKNVDLLLRAFERVGSQRPDAVLWIVGDGPDRARLEAIAGRSKGLPVRFLGEISEPRAINSFYMIADVFALPGTGGLALNQAMTFGKPVVVSKADGTEEDLVTDGHNGLYFKPNDSADLAAKLLELLNNNPLRAEMGRRSRELILHTINMTNMVNSFRDAIFDHQHAPA